MGRPGERPGRRPAKRGRPASRSGRPGSGRRHWGRARVTGVPAVLAWTAMAAYGARIYGPAGLMLPAFSEGAMWALAAATTRPALRDRHHLGHPAA